MRFLAATRAMHPEACLQAYQAYLVLLSFIAVVLLSREVVLPWSFLVLLVLVLLLPKLRVVLLLSPSMLFS